jgi:NitT/TauT family transport system substrate-binding protein
LNKAGRLLALGLAALVFAAVGASAGSSGIDAKPKPKPKPKAVAKPKCTTPTNIDFRLNWVVDYENGLYFNAIDKGWYKGACLNVNIQAGTGSTSAVQLVASGAAPMGVADVISVVAGQAQGLPVTAVGVLMQRNPSAFVIREDSLTQAEKNGKSLDLSVLTGKTYGQTVGSAQAILWQSLTKTRGFDPDKVKTVTVTPPGFAELASGKVDFLANWEFIKPVLETNLKVKVRVLRFEDLQPLGYGLVYIVNNTWLKTHEKDVRAFLEVTKRSMIATAADPAGSVDRLCAHEASNCSTEQAKQVTIAQYTGVASTYKSTDKKRPYLCINAAKWAQTQAALADGGVPSNGPGPGKAFTNKYLKGC